MRKEVCADLCFRLGDAGVLRLLITRCITNICYKGLLPAFIVIIFCRHFFAGPTLDCARLFE